MGTRLSQTQSGQVPAQAGAAAEMWNQKPEALIWWQGTTPITCDTGQALSSPTCSMGPKPHPLYLPMGGHQAQTMKKRL